MTSPDNTAKKHMHQEGSLLLVFLAREEVACGWRMPQHIEASGAKGRIQSTGQSVPEQNMEKVSGTAIAAYSWSVRRWSSDKRAKNVSARGSSPTTSPW